MVLLSDFEMRHKTTSFHASCTVPLPLQCATYRGVYCMCELTILISSSFPQTETRVGLYVELLEDWFSQFPREQFLIQRLEDYSKNRSEVMNNIFRHIGVGTLICELYQRFLMWRSETAWLSMVHWASCVLNLLDQTFASNSFIKSVVILGTIAIIKCTDVGIE